MSEWKVLLTPEFKQEDLLIVCDFLLRCMNNSIMSICASILLPYNAFSFAYPSISVFLPARLNVIVNL